MLENIDISRVIENLNGTEITETFYGKELQTCCFQNSKCDKEKNDKLYVKWKKYVNSFNSLINASDRVK